MQLCVSFSSSSLPFRPHFARLWTPPTSITFCIPQTLYSLNLPFFTLCYHDGFLYKPNAREATGLVRSQQLQPPLVASQFQQHEGACSFSPPFQFSRGRLSRSEHLPTLVHHHGRSFPPLLVTYIRAQPTCRLSGRLNNRNAMSSSCQWSPEALVEPVNRRSHYNQGGLHFGERGWGSPRQARSSASRDSAGLAP